MLQLITAEDLKGMLTSRIMDAKNISTRFESVMASRGIYINETDKQFAYDITSLWLMPEVMLKPTVIAAECGYGKSTLIEILLRYTVRTYPETFGAVIVKQKIDEVSNFVDSINDEGEGEDGREQVGHYCFGIRGYNPDEMTQEDYKKQFIEAKKYNVIAMTTEMFSRHMQRGALNHFSEFTNNKGNKARRHLLIIDEIPKLTETFKFTSKELTELLADVRNVAQSEYDKDSKYYKTIEQYVSMLRRELERPRDGESKKEIIPPIDEYFTIPEDLRRDWAANYQGKDFSKLEAFQAIIRGGGILVIRSNGVYIQKIIKLWQDPLGYNCFILDATVEYDKNYDVSNFNLLKPERAHNYSNVTIMYSDTTNFSRMVYSKMADIFPRIGEMVRDILEHFPGEMLIGIYKEYVEKLKQELANEILCGRVTIKYFDSGRSTNDYANFDMYLPLGNLLKDDSYYPMLANAIYGEELGYSCVLDQKGIIYNDTRVEAVKVSDIATNHIQAANRLRPRNTNRKIIIFLFNRDNDVKNIIAQFFPKARLKEFTPIQRFTNRKETAADKFIDYIKGMKKGETIKASKIYRDILDISRHGFMKVEKDERVREALKRCGVIKQKTFYKKF